MTEREQFEAWAKVRYAKNPHFWLRQIDDGGYSCGMADSAWDAWQAARAQPAQVVPPTRAPFLRERQQLEQEWSELRRLQAQYKQAVPVLTESELRSILQGTNHMVKNAMHGAFWPELEEACRAVEQAVRAKMGVAVPMTDQEILDAAEAIKAKRVETAVKNTLSRVGSKCSQCGGVMGTDHNGYHLFNRCQSCSYVPMFMQDGSEFPPPPGIVGKEGA